MAAAFGGDITVGPYQVFTASVLASTNLNAAFQLDLADARVNGKRDCRADNITL